MTSFVQTLVSLGLVDDALALHCAHREHAEPLVRVEQLGMVLAGLAPSSRWEDSRALLEGSAPFPYPLLEARIATWSLRLVPGLVASGQTEKATALASTTRTRLAAGPTLA